MTAAYVAHLRSLLATGEPDPEAGGPMGFRMPMRRFLRIRIFDVWSHEQDIRRATGRPGNLDGEAAEVSFRMITNRLSSALSEAGVPSGTRVTIEATGHAVRRFDLVAGEPRTAGNGADPAAVLRVDMLDFVARACGRRDSLGRYLGTVHVTGDANVGTRLVEHLAVTP